MVTTVMEMMEGRKGVVTEMLIVMTAMVMNLEVPPDTVIPRGNQRAGRGRPQREPDRRTSHAGSAILGVTWGKSLNLSGPWFPTWQCRADTLCPAQGPGLGGPCR